MHKETVAVSRVGDLGLEIWQDNDPPQPEEQHGLSLYIDPGYELIPHRSPYKTRRELCKGLLARYMEYDLVEGQGELTRAFAEFCFTNRSSENITEYVMEKLLGEGILSNGTLMAAGRFFIEQGRDLFIDYLVETSDWEELLEYVETICDGVSIWPVHLVGCELGEEETDYFFLNRESSQDRLNEFRRPVGYIFGALRKTPENIKLVDEELDRYSTYYRRRLRGDFFGATFYKICPCCQHWSPATKRHSELAFGDPSHFHDRERILEALFPARHRDKREKELELVEALEWGGQWSQGV